MAFKSTFPAAAAAFFLAAGCNSPEPDVNTELAAPAAPDTAAGGGVFAMPYLMRDLDNGLRVVIVPTDYPDIVSLHIPVQTGARNETEAGKTGFAHFFEHMMFRGTKNHSAEEYLEVLKEAGASQNASTSDDHTNYYVSFTKPDLETILELEADRFKNIDYTESVFRTEALSVKGEYLKNFSNPLSKAYERLRALAFDEHPYGHTAMGFIEDIEQMPGRFAYSRTFFDRWYRPEKAAIILVGDLEPEPTFELVKKYWGDWRAGNYTADIPAEGPPDGPRYEHIAWEADTQPWFLTAFRGPAFDPAEPDMPAIDVIASVYFADSSDLYRRVVLEEQWADRLVTYFPNRKDPNLLLVYARLTDAAHADAVETAIRETLAAARSTPMSAETLAETRSRLKYAFAGELDNSRAIASMLSGYLHFSRTPETVNRLYASYDALTPETVRQVANTYFTDARRATVTLANAESLGDVDGMASVDALVEPVPAAASSPATEDALPPAPGPFDSGEDSAPVELVELPLASSALVDVMFLVNSGAAADPPGKRGLAALTAALVADGGTVKLGIDAINDAMYPLAASFDAQVGKEMTRFSGQVHRDNLEAWYRLAAGQLLEPAFAESDFERLRTRLVNAIRSDLVGNNDEELGKEVLYAEIHGPNHPYGAPNGGTSGDLGSLTLDDVRGFYRQHYTRRNLTVGLSGGYPADFPARIDADLQRLPAGRQRAVAIPAPAAIEANRARIVQKETPAVAVSFGFPIDLERGDDDWLALWLVRSWLGEHRSTNGRLHQAIRDQRGMNYGDYAYIEYFPAGMFRMQPGTNHARQRQIFQVWLRPLRTNADAHFATRAALHELDRLLEQGLSAADFATTRAFLTKNVSLLTDGQTRQLGYRLDSRYYRISDFRDYVRDGLATLTVDDVNRVAREQLRTGNLQFVFVTRDAEDLQARLVADRASPVSYDNDMPAALLEEDRLIELRPVRFSGDDVRIVPAGEVFRKMNGRAIGRVRRCSGIDRLVWFLRAG